MEEFSVLATHQSMVSIVPLSFLILEHAIISCGEFGKIKCIDNNLRPFINQSSSNPQVFSQLSQVSKIAWIKLLERKQLILEKNYC